MTSEQGLDQDQVNFSLSAYFASTVGSFTESARLGLESALIANGADAVIVNVGLWWGYVHPHPFLKLWQCILQALVEASNDLLG